MKRLQTIAIVVAAATLGGFTGCGGEEAVAREELNDRLARINERGGELWGRLAERAQSLETDQRLPGDVEEALTELVAFQQQTVAELESLTPPDAAKEPIEMLIEALRKRTEALTQVIRAGSFSEQDSDRVTQAGEEIDEAFEQLRAAGFVPATDDHQES
jgi:hypothetical protein